MHDVVELSDKRDVWSLRGCFAALCVRELNDLIAKGTGFYFDMKLDLELFDNILQLKIDLNLSRIYFII